MRNIKVGINCKDSPTCSCDRQEFPYGSIKSRKVCEIIEVRISDNEGDYVTWMEVFSQAKQLGLTIEEFKEKYSRSFYAEDDRHSFK